MYHLIDTETQNQIADHINNLVVRIIARMDNHGNEEGITPVLGQTLMDHPFENKDTKVNFFYRQLNKNTEENPAGADCGFIVSVQTPDEMVEKSSLFQAKILKKAAAVRDLTMTQADAQRLKKQSQNMLNKTREAVALFYTRQDMYVVDAEHYANSKLSDIQRPLSEDHRLITLGTYLGRWMARCTRGDQDRNLLSRIRRLDGFRKNMTMQVLTKRKPIPWEHDEAAENWQNKRRS